MGRRAARAVRLHLVARWRGRIGHPELRRAGPPGPRCGRAAPDGGRRRRAGSAPLPARSPLSRGLLRLHVRGHGAGARLPAYRGAGVGPAPDHRGRRSAAGRLHHCRAAVPAGTGGRRPGAPLAGNRRAGPGCGRRLAGPRRRGGNARPAAVHLGLDGDPSRGNGQPRPPARQPAGNPDRLRTRPADRVLRLAAPVSRHGPDRQRAAPAVARHPLRADVAAGLPEAAAALAAGDRAPSGDDQRGPQLRLRPVRGQDHCRGAGRPRPVRLAGRSRSTAPSRSGPEPWNGSRPPSGRPASGQRPSTPAMGLPRPRCSWQGGGLVPARWCAASGQPSWSGTGPCRPKGTGPGGWPAAAGPRPATSWPWSIRPPASSVPTERSARSGWPARAWPAVTGGARKRVRPPSGRPPPTVPGPGCALATSASWTAVSCS